MKSYRHLETDTANAALRIAFILAALGSGSVLIAQDKPARTRSCPVEERTSMAARLSDGRTIYVEPVNFASRNGTHVLAGWPTYAWVHSKDNVGLVHLDSTHSGTAMVVDQSGTARLLPKPLLQGEVKHHRILAIESGYAIVFALTEPQVRPAIDPPLKGYWFGITDGIKWLSLERLPLPAGVLDTREASGLVRSGNDFLIAVPLTSPNHDTDVAIYTRSGFWDVQVVRARRTAYIALTAMGSTPFLYIVRPDSTRAEDSNSLSLFMRTAGAWRHQRVVASGGRRPIHHPLIASGDDSTLTWLEDDDATRQRSARAARIRTDGSLGSVVTLGTGIEDVYPVHESHGASRWVVASLAHDGRRALSLVEWKADGPATIDVIVNPYMGFALAFSVDGVEQVIGPRVGKWPKEEMVVSATMRFLHRCHAPPPGMGR